VKMVPKENVVKVKCYMLLRKSWIKTHIKRRHEKSASVQEMWFHIKDQARVEGTSHKDPSHKGPSHKAHPTKYKYQCCFCPAKQRSSRDLFTHLESKHFGRQKMLDNAVARKTHVVARKTHVVARKTHVGEERSTTTQQQTKVS
jgi:hypothetical protein